MAGSEKTPDHWPHFEPFQTETRIRIELSEELKVVVGPKVRICLRVHVGPDFLAFLSFIFNPEPNLCLRLFFFLLDFILVLLRVALIFVLLCRRPLVTVQMRMGEMPTLSHGNVLSYVTSRSNKLIKHVPEARIIWSRELSQLWKYLRIPLLSSVAQETGHPSGRRRSTISPAYGMVSKDCVFDITVDSDY